MTTQPPTDALRLVPVPYVVLSEAAGLLDCEGYGPLALTLNNLLAAAPASPLPGGGQLSKNLGQLKSGQCSGISGELNPELFAENANKSEGKMRDDRTTELPDFLTALFDEWGEEDYGEAATKIARAFLARNGKADLQKMQNNAPRNAPRGLSDEC